MGGRGKKNGICRICTSFGPLTFEHVPPRQAFNNNKVMESNFENWFGWHERQNFRPTSPWTGQGGRQKQGGSGAFTLCGSCNNKTGGWYAPEYIECAKHGLRLLRALPGDRVHRVTFPRCRPLLFLKQTVAMILSVNPPPFAQIHPELVKFVLDKTCHSALSPRYQFYLTLVDGCYSRSSNVSVIGNINNGSCIMLTEVAHVPFSLIMTLDASQRLRVGSITHFGDYPFDQVVDAGLFVTSGELATPYSNDFRSRQAVDKQVERNGLQL